MADKISHNKDPLEAELERIERMGGTFRNPLPTVDQPQEDIGNRLVNRAITNAPDQQLDPSSFISQDLFLPPDFNRALPNSTIFPNINRPLKVGEVSGPLIGTQPIFQAKFNINPGIVTSRIAELQRAANRAAILKSQPTKDEIKTIKRNFDFVTHPRYKKILQENYLEYENDQFNKFLDRNDNDPVKAMKEMEAGVTKEAQEYQMGHAQRVTYGTEVQEFVKEADELFKRAVEEGDYTNDIVRKRLVAIHEATSDINKFFDEGRDLSELREGLFVAGNIDKAINTHVDGIQSEINTEFDKHWNRTLDEEGINRMVKAVTTEHYSQSRINDIAESFMDLNPSFGLAGLKKSEVATRLKAIFGPGKVKEQFFKYQVDRDGIERDIGNGVRSTDNLFNDMDQTIKGYREAIEKGGDGQKYIKESTLLSESFNPKFYAQIKIPGAARDDINLGGQRLYNPDEGSYFTEDIQMGGDVTNVFVGQVPPDNVEQQLKGILPPTILKDPAPKVLKDGIIVEFQTRRFPTDEEIAAGANEKRSIIETRFQVFDPANEGSMLGLEGYFTSSNLDYTKMQNNNAIKADKVPGGQAERDTAKTLPSNWKKDTSKLVIGQLYESGTFKAVWTGTGWETK